MTFLRIAVLVLVILPPSTLYGQEEFYHPELEWRSIETPHFYVHYHLGTERTARTVAKIAEEIYEPITSLYNHEPDGKVSFVIKDYDDYSNGAAYFYENKIEIWASALDTDLRGTHNWLRNVITHEFTHIVQMQTTFKFGRKFPGIYFQWLGYENERRPDVLYGYPNTIVSYPYSGFVVPSWFAEGVAQYNRKELGYDKWDSHRDMILRMYALDDNMLSWNEMSVFGKTSLGNESSYNAGFAFVRYISEKYGDDKVKEISRNLSSLTAVSIDGAIEKAVGLNGKELYNEWREFLKKDYAERTTSLRHNLAAGEIIANVGFANFYPTFSPDGSKLAYISNKTSDYFSHSSLYMYDLATKEEKKIQGGIRSSFSWSPDGKKIYYSKHSRNNDHWSNYTDLYVYDLASEEETRLTKSMRASAPDVSPDGKRLAFLIQKDGTVNLYTSDLDGSNIKQLTNYTGGEQLYTVQWSPDGSTLVFDYSIKEGRDIGTIPAEGGSVTFVLSSGDDERNPMFTPDGKQLIYASDPTGIFNIYSYDLQTKQSSQLTNVLGGAFMPSMNQEGKLAFASYTSTGYKIAFMSTTTNLQQPPSYVPENRIAPVTSDVHLALATNGTDGNVQHDWKRLAQYDDTVLPDYPDTKYKNIAGSLSIVPFLRVDNYNPKNKGIDVIKPGVYLFSYDMLDRYGFFASAAINKRGERDLFFTFDYRGKIPGFYQLGLEPAASLEAFNVTRKSDNRVELREGLTIPVEVTYNLLEFDVAFRQKIFSEALDLELRYAHSRYNADIGSFIFQDPELPDQPAILVPSFGNLYLAGNDLTATLNLNAIALSRTMDINPVGRKVRIRYDYEFNKFQARDSSGASKYEVTSDGLFLPVYDRPRFHRLEGQWTEHQRLPGWKHTLTMKLRGGSVLGTPVDDFFDFYIGGLAGMKGYPFYSMGGNEFGYLNAAYRFPVWENIDVRFLHLHFHHLYAALYGDVGAAWTGGGLKGKKYNRDAGAELRLEAFSFYSYPTRIFFNATYGFDKFDRYVASTGTTVTYGHEWNFHFGILFGFDLD